MISIGYVMVASVAAIAFLMTPPQDINSTTTATTATTTRTAQSSPTVPDAATAVDDDTPPPHLVAHVGQDYQVLKVIPHDEQAFTQGLFIHDGHFLEGTGNYGESVIRISNMQDGTILKEMPLDAKYFGEGISSFTTVNNKQDDDGSPTLTTTRLVQLTYKAQIGLIYDIDTLEVIHQFPYTTNTTEGWGITFDAANHELLVSDGSEWIHVWDADTFKEKRRYPVTFVSQNQNPNKPPMAVKTLNELEFDASTNTLLANVWYQNVILRIDPVSGQVIRVYDMGQLYPAAERSPTADSFNGIAIVAESPNEIWVTGKWWPHMYLIRLLA